MKKMKRKRGGGGERGGGGHWPTYSKSALLSTHQLILETGGVDGLGGYL
jgi:hypothetical protein